MKKIMLITLLTAGMLNNGIMLGDGTQAENWKERVIAKSGEMKEYVVNHKYLFGITAGIFVGAWLTYKMCPWVHAKLKTKKTKTPVYVKMHDDSGNKIY